MAAHVQTLNGLLTFITVLAKERGSVALPSKQYYGTAGLQNAGTF
jgi:hypothetical protein